MLCHDDIDIKDKQILSLICNLMIINVNNLKKPLFFPDFTHSCHVIVLLKIINSFLVYFREHYVSSTYKSVQCKVVMIY